MQFRYDFVGDKLDLSRFKKQVTQNLIRYEEKLEYYFYVLGYKIQAYVARDDGSTNYIIDFAILELQRDCDGEVKSYSAIQVPNDLRFKEFPDLIKHYTSSAPQGYIVSNSVDEIVDTLSTLIKIIYKINNLKAFL
jgi:hypothetical protein